MELVFEAVKTGSLEMVKKVVAATQGITRDDDWMDYDSLNRAVMRGYRDIAKYLLYIGCRVNNTHKDALPHDTPLHFAVRTGDQYLVYELLMRNASIVALNASGCTPLHLGLLFRHVGAIDVILDYVVKTNSFANPKSNYGLSHMHVACARMNARAVEGYLKNKVDLYDRVSAHSPWWPGYTCLHFAVEFQSLVAVTLLTKYQPTTAHSVHYARNSYRMTPLQLAKLNLEAQTAIVEALTIEEESSE